MTNLIDNLAMIALSCESVEEAYSIGLDQQWWRFRVVNAPADLRQRLHRIHTDPRIIPIHVQYLLGQATWTVKMFEELPRLDHRNPQHIQQNLTHYLMVVLIHCGSPISYLYGGSATGTVPGERGYIGLRNRIGNTHERVISLGNEGVLDLIASGSSQVLFAHVIASLKDAERFYLPITSFPVVEDAVLQRKAKRLALNAEDMGVIYLDCLSVNQNRLNTKTRRGALSNMRSLSIAAVARPKNMPQSPFRGLNIVLPESQPLNVGSTSISENLELQKRLEAYYRKTKRPYLPTLDLSQLREQLSLPSVGLKTVVASYRTILAENGKSYQSSSTRIMGFKIVVFCAVIKYCESTNPPLVTLANGRYTAPDPRRLDWQQILHISLELVPEWVDESYFSKETCRLIWSYTGKESEGISHLVFEQRNWDVLRGM